jgi:hypothetical protein
MGAPQRVLTLAFLRPGPDEKDSVNWLVSKMSRRGISHVELVFEDGMAFSIFAGENLYFKHRTFSNPDYELVSLSVSQMEYVSAYTFCQQAVGHNLVFTDVGMVACYFQPRRCPCINTGASVYLGCTFCSKIVTEALDFASVPEVEGLSPCATTPSCLYEAVCVSERKVLSSVPYKRNQLQQVGVWRGRAI